MSESTQVTITLERGLQVLRAFRAERAPMTNAELVKRTGLSRSTVSRLTSTLLHMGYIRRVAGGKEFELAPAGFGIGQAYAKTNPVTQRVHPAMQAVADRMRVSVALAVPDHLDMLYIAYRSSDRIATLRMDVGSLLPRGRTAIGRAWLWNLPPQQRADRLAAILEAAGAEADTVRRRIEDAFAQLDATGVCVAIGERYHDAYGIALPLRVGRSGTPMAMNYGAVGVDLDAAAIRERLAASLKESALEVAALLRDVDVLP